MFPFLESGHYFGTAKKGIVDKQFGTEGVFFYISWILLGEITFPLKFKWERNLLLHQVQKQNTMMLGDDEGVIQNINTPPGSHFANSVSPHPHKHNYVITV